jgi:undecaprenyl diphosphate synthase
MADKPTVPAHVGLILDGNRRWAKARGLPVFEGHRQGYETLRRILDAALEHKIKYVSAYVFSTENWQRTSAEVKFIMNLLVRMLTRDLQELDDRGVRIVWLGSKQGVSDRVRSVLENAEAKTADNAVATLGLCLNHGGHREIAEAVQRIVTSGTTPETITEQTIAEVIDVPDVPPIDLLIRTGGEQRLSNFMLWRAAYAELAFTDTFWPDFSDEEFAKLLNDYAVRQRRFGK